MVEKQSNPKLHKLFPNLSDEELLIAEENLQAFVDHAVRQYERIRNNPEAHERFKKLLEEQKNGSDR